MKRNVFYIPIDLVLNNLPGQKRMVLIEHWQKSSVVCPITLLRQLSISLLLIQSIEDEMPEHRFYKKCMEQILARIEVIGSMATAE